MSARTPSTCRSPRSTSGAAKAEVRLSRLPARGLDLAPRLELATVCAAAGRPEVLERELAPELVLAPREVDRPLPAAPDHAEDRVSGHLREIRPRDGLAGHGSFR